MRTDDRIRLRLLRTVLVVAVVGGAFLVWRGTIVIPTTSSYSYTARFLDVSGLRTGADVTCSGFLVGNVALIEIHDRNGQAPEFNVTIKASGTGSALLDRAVSGMGCVQISQPTPIQLASLTLLLQEGAPGERTDRPEQSASVEKGGDERRLNPCTPPASRAVIDNLERGTTAFVDGVGSIRADVKRVSDQAMLLLAQLSPQECTFSDPTCDVSASATTSILAKIDDTVKLVHSTVRDAKPHVNRMLSDLTTMVDDNRASVKDLLTELRNLVAGMDNAVARVAAGTDRVGQEMVELGHSARDRTFTLLGDGGRYKDPRSGESEGGE